MPLLLVVLVVIAIVLVLLFGESRAVNLIAKIGGLTYALWILVQLARWIMGLSG